MLEDPNASPAVRPPSMIQVAQVAGVSAQTVSRVLREHPNVASSTRERVMDAVNTLGYRRNSTARALVTGRSMLLGVVMLETNFYAGNSILQAVQAAARERGYFVTNSSTSSIDLAAVKTASDRLIDQGVDGQILAVPVRDVAELKEVLGPVPAVVIDGTGGQSDASANQIEIGRAATRHLLELGHKTVWHVAGPDTWGDASARTEGWHEELVKSGCEVPPLLYGDWTPESGYRNGLLLGRIDDATAIFVSSDEMAIGLIAGLREMGRQVPGDVSVIGVDDIALARYSNPALTTWRQPFEEVGFQAVDLLLQHLDDITAIATVDTPLGELVIRDSTAAIDTAS